MRGRAVAVGAVGAVGAVVVGAFASLGGCVEEVRLFDVELRVRIADGVDPAVNVAAAGLDNERLGLSFNYFPDVGLANGGDARSLKGLPFDADASSARFELLAFIDAVNVGRGSSPVSVGAARAWRGAHRSNPVGQRRCRWCPECSSAPARDRCLLQCRRAGSSLRRRRRLLHRQRLHLQ